MLLHIQISLEKDIALRDGKLNITGEGDMIGQMLRYNFVLFDTQQSCFATTVVCFIVASYGSSKLQFFTEAQITNYLYSICQPAGPSATLMICIIMCDCI